MEKQAMSVDDKQQQNTAINWQGVLALGTNAVSLPSKQHSQQTVNSSFVVLP